MKRLYIIVVALLAFAVGISCDFSLTAEEFTTTASSTLYAPTTAATSTTAWYQATTAQRYYNEIPRVCLWHGDITIEYGQSFDFIDMLPFDRYYSSTIEIWGEEETTFATDYDGNFNAAFNTCYLVNINVSPDHFIITNWNPEPLTINEINMFVW